MVTLLDAIAHHLAQACSLAQIARALLTTMIPASAVQDHRQAAPVQPLAPRAQWPAITKTAVASTTHMAVWESA